MLSIEASGLSVLLAVQFLHVSVVEKLHLIVVRFRGYCWTARTAAERKEWAIESRRDGLAVVTLGSTL